MKILNYKLTRHALKDRANRIRMARRNGGFGGELKRIPSHNNVPDVFEILTSTGIVLVVNEPMKLCLTLYEADLNQLQRFYA